MYEKISNLFASNPVINDSLQDSSSICNDSYKYHDLNAESVIDVTSPRDTSNDRRTFSSVSSQIMKLFVKNEFNKTRMRKF
jgi:hypothetical protein